MSWPAVLLLGVIWLSLILRDFRAMQVEEVGVDRDVLLRYYDRTFRLLNAADRAGFYARWIVGSSEKEQMLKALQGDLVKPNAYALGGDRLELLQWITLETGEREELEERFADLEFRESYKSWLMAGEGHAWHYERFVHEVGDKEVSRFYASQNDRLLLRVVGMSLVFDVLTLCGIGFMIYLFVKRQPAQLELHRLPERWPIRTVLGGFFAANLLLLPWSMVMGYIYDFLTIFIPEILAYIAYDFSWRMFDAMLLLLLLLKTPRNAWRVFRLDKPIHLPLLLAVFSATGLFDLALYFVVPFVDVDPSDFMYMADPDRSSFLAMLFLTVIVAPIFEEIVFRGFLFQGLREKLGTLSAGVISTLLFTLGHVQYDIWGCLSVAIMGAGAAFLTLRTGSLNTAIVFHALVNLLVAANTYYQYQAPL
jgi:membrane protease YdiL (CAAX protease family)